MTGWPPSPHNGQLAAAALRILPDELLQHLDLIEGFHKAGNTGDVGGIFLFDLMRLFTVSNRVLATLARRMPTHPQPSPITRRLVVLLCQIPFQPDAERTAACFL